MGQFGHAKIMLKVDGEYPITALAQTIQVGRPEGACTIIERPPKGERRSNHTIEGSVAVWKGMFGAIKDAVEQRMSNKVMMDSPLLPCMVAHSAAVRNREQRGRDGKTAMETCFGEEEPNVHHMSSRSS